MQRDAGQGGARGQRLPQLRHGGQRAALHLDARRAASRRRAGRGALPGRCLRGRAARVPCPRRVRLVVEPEQRSPEIEARFINLKRMALEALQLLPQVPRPTSSAPCRAASEPVGADRPRGGLSRLRGRAKKQELIETIDPVARVDKVDDDPGPPPGGAAADGRDRPANEGHLRRPAEGSGAARTDGRDPAPARRGGRRPRPGGGRPVGRHRPRRACRPTPKAAARKELRRYERSSDASPESGMIRNHLDWMVELPWALPDGSAHRHRRAARRVLDADHFGLKKIKDRIVEYLAVRKLAPNGKAPILCFAGPPGVGKTSLGQSIARAMGRPFVRVSLGGVHDEAEIRGHRSTYIGALPGVIVQGLRKANARNCVMMLDEIDKMGRGDGRRPGGRDAGGARPRAERELPRQLHRHALRPVARGVHRHRQHAGHDPRPAARPHGDHPARRATPRPRSWRSPKAISCDRQTRRQRPLEARAGRSSSDSARCGRSSPAIPGKRACATWSARSAPCCATRP